MNTWLTSADAELVALLWADAPEDDDELDLYLVAAKEACIAYAPALAEGTPVPDSYRFAQAMQASNLYNAGQASATGTNDGSGFGLTTFPLDWQVQQLLRPRRGMGAIA